MLPAGSFFFADEAGNESGNVAKRWSLQQDTALEIIAQGLLVRIANVEAYSQSIIIRRLNYYATPLLFTVAWCEWGPRGILRMAL